MAAGQINFLETVVGHAWEPIAAAFVAAGAVSFLFKTGSKKLNESDNSLVPDENFSIKNFADLITGFLFDLGDKVMGKHNRKYLPFVSTLFVYILSMNLMGLIPGLSGPTDEIPRGVMFNLGIAIVVLFMYNAWGIKEVGLKNYLKHFLGPVPAIAFILVPIEIVSHLFRPLTLSIRLAGNMTADHAVLSTFVGLTKIGVPLIFYGLGTFVCCVQAFVFTMLTMLYIGLATAHEEH